MSLHLLGDLGVARLEGEGGGVFAWQLSLNSWCRVPTMRRARQQIQLQFDPLPPRRGENAHQDARLAREMRGLTSMAWEWDDKYAR